MLVGLRLRYTLYADRVLHYLHTLSTAAAGVGDGYSGSRATALDGAKDGISFGNDMIFFINKYNINIDIYICMNTHQHTMHILSL
jgi:hypothetical protein